MPGINHYEAEVTIRFAIDGPLSPADAAMVAENRASKALDSYDGEGNSIQSADITALSVRDMR